MITAVLLQTTDPISGLLLAALFPLLQDYRGHCGNPVVPNVTVSALRIVVFFYFESNRIVELLFEILNRIE